MPYLLATKGLRVVCISYTVEAAHDLVYDLIDRGWKLEPSDMDTYLDKRDKNGGFLQTYFIDSNTKISI